jgi:hypothetical protein
MRISGALSVNELEGLLLHAFRASKDSRYCPIMIWGEAGIGKSETVARVARDLGIGFKDLRLGLFEAPDLVGVFRQQEVFPCFLDFQEGQPNASKGKLYTRYALFAHLWEKHRSVLPGEGPDQVVEWAIEEARKAGLGHLFSIRTVNSPPSWLPQPGTMGILFLDELNRATREVRQGTFQIVLDRIVGQIPLPGRWILVSANNPPDTEGKGGGYRVNQTEDRAFLSRWCHVAVEPKTSEWLSWARRAGVHPAVRAFISEKGGEYLGSMRSVDIPNLSPTPRSWTMLSKLIQPIPPEAPGAPPGLLDEALIVAAATGLVGVEATRTWLALRMVPDPLVTSIDLLANYADAYARLRKFLSYPIYDAATGQPRLGPDGQPLLSRRSDLVRVAFETLTDTLFQMKKKNFSEEPGYHPVFGDLKAVSTAIKLATDSYQPPDEGGLGMGDVTMQFFKLWVNKGLVSTMLIAKASADPAVKQAFALVGVEQPAVLALLKEYGALTGKKGLTK